MSYMHADEERRLIEKVRREHDPVARETLIETHFYIIRMRLPRYLNQGLEQEDLFQEGVFGLIRAVEDFDPDKARFATHADSWVKECLRMAVFRQGNAVKAPVGVQKNLGRRRRFERDFEERHGRPPTKDEVVAALQISPKSFDKTTDALKVRAVVSIESQRHDQSRIDPVDPRSVEVGQRSETVRRQLVALPRDQRRVLARKFGIAGDDRQMSHAEIGRVLGWGVARVKQTYEEAAEAIRETELAEA